MNINNIYRKAKNKYFRNRSKKSFLNILIFIIITYGLHKLWWENISWLQESKLYQALADLLTQFLFKCSYWINTNILGFKLTHTDTTMWFSNNGFITINKSCSGLKQQYQWVLLMIFFPGPWRKKLWFIPTGMLIMYTVNILRILILSGTLLYLPQYWHFAHDWILRPGFYIVIFGMWVYWEKRI